MAATSSDSDTEDEALQSNNSRYDNQTPPCTGNNTQDFHGNTLTLVVKHLAFIYPWSTIKDQNQNSFIAKRLWQHLQGIWLGVRHKYKWNKGKIKKSLFLLLLSRLDVHWKSVRLMFICCWKHERCLWQWYSSVSICIHLFIVPTHTHTHSATFSLSKMAAKILYLTHLTHGAVNLTNCCYFTVHRRHYREPICWDFTHFFKHLFYSDASSHSIHCMSTGYMRETLATLVRQKQALISTLTDLLFTFTILTSVDCLHYLWVIYIWNTSSLEVVFPSNWSPVFVQF